MAAKVPPQVPATDEALRVIDREVERYRRELLAASLRVARDNGGELVFPGHVRIALRSAQPSQHRHWAPIASQLGFGLLGAALSVALGAHAVSTNPAVLSGLTLLGAVLAWGFKR